MGTPDDIDISLWRPYGSRRVEHILLSDPPEELRQRHIQYAAIGEFNLLQNHTTLAAWQAKTGAQVIAKGSGTMTILEGPREWYIVRLPD
jgi:hypothetical protein